MPTTVRARNGATLAERFWPRVRKGDGGCWEWDGSLRAGYGHMRDDEGHTDRAHRVSWRLHFGEIPAGMLVCHHCDNRKCVRPDHLFPGPYTDNARDRTEKGRSAVQVGERNPRSKVGEREVLEIRGRIAAGEPAERVGREYGISPTQSRRIRDGESWGHLAGAG
jgi:hypothetical protein